MGYQPLMREALRRFAEAEMKRLGGQVRQRTPMRARPSRGQQAQAAEGGLD